MSAAKIFLILKMKFQKYNPLVPWMTMGLIFVLGFQTEGNAKDWPLLGESNHYQFFYDEEGMSTTPKGIITVWIRLIPQNEKSKKKYFEDRRASGLSMDGYETFEYDQKLIKVNCPDLTFRIAQRIDFGKGGRVLGFHNLSSEWQPIPPRSAAEALVTTLCP
ncbi:MAG TPA: surface-adhesin E family protein [Nitrospiria bacterium]|jgi:hypothetical protein